MIEHINTIREWLDEPVTIVRVIRTWGSSPRPIGSVMLISHEGKMAGSISGGCVEGAVVKSAMENLHPTTAMLNFGVSDDEAWSVGLSCGGNIEAFLETADFMKDELWSNLLHAVDSNQSAILISSLEYNGNQRSLVLNDDNVIGDPLKMGLLEMAQKAYQDRTHRSVEFQGKEYFIQLFPRKPVLLIIGAAHITVDLVTLGNMYGFETVVIDPRGYFTTNTVFDDPPTQLIEAYPSEVLDQFGLDAYTFAAVLSHDPKIDDDALQILLNHNVAYIGALGSRKNHEKRKKRLQERGIRPEQIDRIKAPIGMDINAKSAREIAMSIMAQVIEVKNKFQ